MRVLFALCCVGSLVMPPTAYAQEHHHPPQDVQLHEKFCSTWYMPDQPTKSCCNKQDCYPTEIKYVGKTLFARRREDGEWIVVPPQKIERNRDNPDGRNHVCMPPPITHRLARYSASLSAEQFDPPRRQVEKLSPVAAS